MKNLIERLELVESGPLVSTGRKKVSKEEQKIAKEMGRVAKSRGILDGKPTFYNPGNIPRDRPSVINMIEMANNVSYMGHTVAGKVGIGGSPDSDEFIKTVTPLFFFAATPFSAQGIARHSHLPVYFIFKKGSGEMTMHYYIMVRKPYGAIGMMDPV